MAPSLKYAMQLDQSKARDLQAYPLLCLKLQSLSSNMHCIWYPKLAIFYRLPSVKKIERLSSNMQMQLRSKARNLPTSLCLGVESKSSNVQMQLESSARNLLNAPDSKV